MGKTGGRKTWTVVSHAIIFRWYDVGLEARYELFPFAAVSILGQIKKITNLLLCAVITSV